VVVVDAVVVAVVEIAGNFSEERVVMQPAPFFRYLDPALLKLIFQKASEKQVPEKTTLLKEGEISSLAFLLLEGEVNLTLQGENSEELVRGLKPGAVFGRGPISQEAESVTYTTTSPSRFLVWSQETITDLFHQFPDLKKQLLTRISLTRRLWEILELLKRSSLFRGMSPPLLRRMVDGATLSFFPAQTVIFKEGDVGDSFYLVVNGEIQIFRGEKNLSYLYPGDSFGEISLLKKMPRNASALSTQDTTLLIFNQQDFQILSEQSSIFRHAIHALMEERLGIHDTLKKTAELILVINHSPPSSSILISQICESLHSQFQEKACIVTDPEEALNKKLSGEFHYVFLVPSREQEQNFINTLQNQLSSLLFVTPDSQSFPYPIHVTLQTLHVLLTDKDRPSFTRRGAIRLCWPLTPESIHRLTRALSHRMVGVALGGGGAWGLSHIALLRGMTAQNIPIDLISGTSFGSIVGASFSSGGLKGIHSLLKKRRAMHLVSKLLYWTTWPMARLAQTALKHHELQELEIPFFPVALNILTGEEKVFRQGSITKSLRASCAFPALIAPATFGEERYVDGGVINNVPASVIAEEGADFIVASNVIPPPKKIRSYTNGNWALQIWSALWPRSRIKDLVRSLYILLKQVGERQSSCADMTFTPDLSSFLSSEFLKAEEIVKKSEESLEPFLTTLKERYRTFCVRR